MSRLSLVLLATTILLASTRGSILNGVFGQKTLDTKDTPLSQLPVATLQKWCSLAQSIRKCPIACTSSVKSTLITQLNDIGIYQIPDAAIQDSAEVSPQQILGGGMPCPQFKYVNLDQLKMYYLLWKPAPGSPPKTPIVLIGGWSGVKEDWQAVAPQWTAAPLSRTILTVDIRGVGQTGLGPTPGNYSAPQIARDIAELIQQVFPNQQVFVIGGALGGKFVLQMAVDFPNLFKAIIPSATQAGGSLSVPGPRRPEFFQLVLSGQFRFRLYRYAQAIFSPEWAKNNVLTWVLLFLRGALYSRPQEGILRTADIAMSYDFSGNVHLVNQPTLCLHGSDDEIALPKSSELLAAAIGANAEFEELTNEGHAFWFQDPAEIIKDAELFFAKL